MLEIRRTRAAVVACHARPGDLEGLEALAGDSGAPGAEVFRVAPDEHWLVAPPAAAAGLLARANERFSASAGSAMAGAVLVVDESDGWTLFELAGEERLEPFAALAEFPLPGAPAFAQGAFAGVPAKFAVDAAAIRLFVPSPFGDHVERRLRSVCAAGTRWRA